ncbi:hypothetical protein [Thaumasiovibrio subtropicus]|uniref:hypothetical protein n=1 Tax=Thaumasiovibrio subtropicus TaxID=1891207 RepID=UPI000B361547|nr:hypothetical protein [Thaumasiovibrio subtropicus]
MSINSIDREEMKNVASHWSHEETDKRSESKKRADARRRIEALRDIKDSGLTYEEAVDLGLIH